MMNGAQNGHRKQGVRGTAPAKKDGYSPNQLIGARIGFVGLVTYSDDNGKAHQNMAFFIGDQIYLDKGGERWMQENLRTAAPWLADQLRTAYDRQLPQLLAQAGVEGLEAEGSEVPAQEVDVVPAAPAAPPGAEKSTKARLTSALAAGGQG